MPFSFHLQSGKLHAILISPPVRETPKSLCCRIMKATAFTHTPNAIKNISRNTQGIQDSPQQPHSRRTVPPKPAPGQRMFHYSSGIPCTTRQDITFQLAPPVNHRENASELAERTFKTQFIANLFSTNPHFSIHLWDRLITQAVLTLSLLHGSCNNPKLDAHSLVFGQ
jgi:hypothetical protein